MWALLLTIVITDPYQGIKHNEATIYEYSQKSYLENVIHVHEPDHSDYYGHDDSNYGNSSTYEDSSDSNSEINYSNKKDDYIQNQLNYMYPYIFPRNY